MIAKAPLARWLALSALFLGFAFYTVYASEIEPVPIRESFVTFPMTVNGWIGAKSPDFTEKELAVLGVDEYLTRSYRLERKAYVGLYIGYYQSQRQGDTIHSPLNCLPGAGWEPMSKSYLPVQVMTASPEAGGESRTIEINRYLIRKGLDRQVVLYWYQSQGRVVANEYSSKVYMVLDAIRSNRTDAAMVRIVAPVLGDDEAAEARAERNAVEFVQSIFPHLGRYLPS
jgi:EpsI family protein